MTGPERDDPSLIFLRRWQTDIGPVHERTERSREFRTGYWQLALRSLLILNGGALVASPAVGRLVGAPIATEMELFLRSQGWFLAGLLLVVLATLFSLITLDTDVIRQKGERALARDRLLAAGFEDRHPDSLESQKIKSERHQKKYWRLGVGLFWTSVVLMAIAALAFLRGCMLAAEVLARAAV